MGKIINKAIRAIAENFVLAMHETQTLSQTMGALVRDAAKECKTAQDVDLFIAECRACAEGADIPAASLKVYLSNARGVLTAMLEGYEPAEGAGLRAMYDARPGSGTTKRGARAGGNSGKTDPATKPGAAVTATRADLIRLLFGFHSAELEAACDYAKDHSAMFMSWASASAKAEQAQLVGKLKKAA
jgi:hypothetical protein